MERFLGGDLRRRARGWSDWKIALCSRLLSGVINLGGTVAVLCGVVSAL